MNPFQSIVLGIVQGAAEFLPVSSSGHLVLVPWAFGWADPGLLFDTLVHWGTLLAVVVYFRGGLWALLQAWVRSVLQRKVDSPEARTAWLILIATIPGAVIGYLFEGYFESLFASPGSVALLLIATGAVLVASDMVYRRVRRHRYPGLGDAVIIGFAQAAAIAPGLSRSGLTIAAGVFRGLSREDAARFSFLLSVPIILGAGLAQIGKTLGAAGGTAWLPLVLGFVSAAVSGYLAIRFLLKFVQRHRLWPFAVYCWCVAAAVLIAGAL